MPWDNNTGGGGRNSNSGGPWGQAPQGGGGGNRRGGGGTPNLEEILSRGRDRFQGGIPGGRWTLLGVALALIAIWAFNSVYTVDPQEVGVETTFGKPSDQLSTAGLHFLVWPIQSVERVNLTENKTEIGTSTSARSGRADDGVMLTSDQNIVSVKFAVLWTITDPKSYLFNVKNPDDMVRAVGESAMREVVGRSPAQEIYRSDRASIQAEVQQIIQTILDNYQVGVNVDQVTIENVAPPAEVADAFAEVQRAQQDQQKFQEDARSYANSKLGQANGEAAAIREDAAAYKNRVVQEAEGEAARFISVYEQYAKAPEVTRKRLYLETMETVIGNSNKVLIDPSASGSSGVLPYLPLPAIQGAQPAPAASPTTATATGVN
jgi:membrane protease subunit HflK